MSDLSSDLRPLVPVAVGNDLSPVVVTAGNDLSPVCGCGLALTKESNSSSSAPASPLLLLWELLSGWVMTN